MRLVVRTTGEPMALAPALRRVVRTLDPDVPLADVSTLEQYRQASMAGPRLAASMLGGFSAVALALAAIGVFGLMSYSVAQRRKEFGLRLALGAQSRDLVGLALRRGLAVTAAGIAIGAVGAWAISHVLAGLLFEVTPGDAATFVATTAILGATAVVASYVPARRATRVDPAITLRAE
jgi:putative ABC transport system permease protein